MTGEKDPFDVFKGGDWSALDAIGQNPSFEDLTPEAQAQIEHQQLEQYTLDRAIHSCFGTAMGPEVLAWMRNIAIEGARFDVANETDAALAAAKGFFREGQAAMYFEIVKRMKRAEDGPPIVQKTSVNTET